MLILVIEEIRLAFRQGSNDTPLIITNTFIELTDELLGNQST